MGWLTVVIPTFQRPELLREAIESVLCQDVEVPEVIVVSDGVSDEDRDICRSFDSPRLRHVNHVTPTGGAGARNTGIRHASGRWVSFLDDDDLWAYGRSGRLQRLAAAVKPRTGLLYCGAVYERHGAPTSRFIPSLRGRLPLSTSLGMVVPSASVMTVRHSFLRAVGGFDAAMPSAQEVELVHRLLAQGCEVDFDPSPDVVLRRGLWPRISTDPARRWAGTRLFHEKAAP